ncbi:hypothetical protein GCM10023094_19120 [Rhodococcus olei]|uniref:Imidazolonepropionase-like amidohydrolase n=1 Tax=Rhodococcus olei TaxID=2161675 RepID=A0ABP8P0S3_9NOCA
MTGATRDTVTVAARQAWLGRWAGPTRFALRGGLIRVLGPDRATTPTAGLTFDGTVFPGFRDAHVHLELVDAAALFAGGLDEVYDLGAGLAAAAHWTSRSDRPTPGRPRIRFAGQFLTAPGGYPGDRAWAPTGSVREITGPSDAADAVTEQVCAGADFVKVTLNSDAGPVLPDGTLRAVVTAAHRLSRGVVAHAEGAGQVDRALAAGVDVLAHAPWTERLGERVVRDAARSMRWISTLDIHRGHDREVAGDNLRRFHAAGGRVRYGTDLGNGDLPAGVNASEVAALFAAGLDRAAVLAAMIDGAAALRFSAGLSRFCWIPGTPPSDDGDFASWLTGARIVAAADLEEELR